MKTKITPNRLTNTLKTALICGLALGAASLAQAETVSIPLGQQGEAWNVQSPAHGISKAQVEDRYGSPLKTMGPVGEPPIYVWDYADFTVYFEGDRVIHSVVKHRDRRG